jgi:hypothetical protein
VRINVYNIGQGAASSADEAWALITAEPPAFQTLASAVGNRWRVQCNPLLVIYIGAVSYQFSGKEMSFSVG